MKATVAADSERAKQMNAKRAKPRLQQAKKKHWTARTTKKTQKWWSRQDNYPKDAEDAAPNDDDDAAMANNDNGTQVSAEMQLKKSEDGGIAQERRQLEGQRSMS